MRKAKNIKVNSEYKYYIHDIIAFIAITLIGFLLLLFGVEETITIAFIFSFVIYMIKIASALVFRGIINKIIMSIYWVFFFLTVMGLILSIVNIKPKGYKIDSFTIKNDSIGFVTNIKINLNDDEYTAKLLKPTIFALNSGIDTDVIYKIDNKKVMYQLYSTNIGVHIFYVGYAYLYILSILLFFVIMIKFVFFEMIPSIIKEIKKNKKKSLKSKYMKK